MEPDQPQDVSFLSHVKLTEESEKSVRQVGASRELKIIAWDRILKLAKSTPKTTEEAAANFHRIKGILSVITE